MSTKNTKIRLFAPLLLMCLLFLTGCSAPTLLPGVLAFDGTRTATINIKNFGPWVATSDQAWLSVSPENGNGDADITVTVNRANLAAGNYSAKVTLIASRGSRVVPVFMSFPDIEGNINATKKVERLHEDGPALVEGQYIPDVVMVVLDAGGAAVSLGKTIELNVDPTLTAAEYKLVGASLAKDYNLDLRSANLNAFEFKARYQDLASLLARLRADGRVEDAQEETIQNFFATPNDPSYSNQWHYDQINLPAAWDLTTGSADIALAVIDSGVQVTHPDLQARFSVPGYDFTKNSSDMTDVNGHGTHVGGTMGAVTNDGVGVAGVTWLNPMIGVRVLGDAGTGSNEDVNRGILFAAGITVENSAGQTVTPTRRAHVMNLSLGPNNAQCTDIPPGGSEVEAVNRALAAGTSVVFAAGNDNCNQLDGGSKIPGVIAVAAVDRNGARTPYSNAGVDAWISAPGGIGDAADAVQSTYLNGAYSGLQGTSMAAPHVAGVIGLMLSVNPNLTPLDIRQIIAETATPIVGAAPISSGSPTQRGGMGYGLINAEAAVAASQNWQATHQNPTVQLVNPQTNAVIMTVPVDAGGNYRIANVPIGAYKIRGGYDNDNDDVLGEPGDLVDEGDVTVDEEGDFEVDLDLHAP